MVSAIVVASALYLGLEQQSSRLKNCRDVICRLYVCLSWHREVAVLMNLLKKTFKKVWKKQQQVPEAGGSVFTLFCVSIISYFCPIVAKIGSGIIMQCTPRNVLPRVIAFAWGANPAEGSCPDRG